MENKMRTSVQENKDGEQQSVTITEITASGALGLINNLSSATKPADGSRTSKRHGKRPC
jgi:hypothetical protein